MYIYNDGAAPGTKYFIRINKLTKVLHGKFYHYCSGKDCKKDVYSASVKLTEEELKYIKKSWNNKEELSYALELICLNEKIFYSSYESSHEDSVDIYNMIDTNNDGKLSYREYGDSVLMNKRSS